MTKSVNLLSVADDLRPATDPPLGPRPLQARYCALTEPHTLLLSDRGEDADYGVLEHPARV